MVNVERKINFIDQLTKNPNSIIAARRAFNWFEDLEDRTGIDICEQEYGILQSTFDEVITSRVSSSRSCLYMLREYVVWCAENGFKTSDGVMKLRIDITNGILRQMFSDPADLRETLDYVFQKPELKTVDTIYRVFLWLGYMGFGFVDALSVTIDDVDLESGFVRFNRKNYNIPEPAYDDFYNAVSLDYFITYHKNPDYEIKKNRCSGRFLLRSFDITSMTLDRFRSAINKKSGAANVTLNYSKVSLSGEFYRWFMKESCGDCINETVESFINSEIDRRQERSSRVFNQDLRKRNLSILKKEFTRDYSSWKNVFHAEEV